MIENLTPSVVSLNKGLDLSSSPFTAEVGSLLSCNNYEITDSDGLRKIDGYEKYDATLSAGNTSLYILGVPSTAGYAVGDYLVATLNPYSGASLVGNPVFLGQVVDFSAPNNTVTLAVSNLDYLSTSSGISRLDKVAGGQTLLTINSITEGSLYYSSATAYMTALIASQAVLRNSTYKRSLGYAADGLHWFRDKEYAVAPLPEIRVRGRNGVGQTIAGTYTIAVTNGFSIGNSANSSEAQVIGSRSETDGSGFKSYFLTIIPLSGTYKDWAAAADPGTGGITITGLTVTPGTAAMVDAIGYTTTDSKYLAPSQIVNTTECLWTCASEQESLDTGIYPMVFGWVPIATNFNLNFENGSSATDPVKMERSFSTVPSTVTYYMTDGANVLSFNMITYFLDPLGPAWSTGNAYGEMQIQNISVVSGVMAQPSPGWTVHSGFPCTAPNRIADVSPSVMVVNALQPRQSLLYYNSKYEFISSNFFADDSWDAMYGVNGAGRAFYYTGDLFVFIYTQIDSTKDRPRHIESHHQHLALGFEHGSVQLSVVGEPFNFLGIDGATEFGLGDKITGLLSLNGTTLGVFCQQSIWSITGTDVDNFDTAVIAPKTGCIEYTLSNMGIPVYCDGSGIQTLAQSEKYGDFIGKPLSYKVNNWLRPRLRRVSNKYTNNIGLIGSMIVRNKNQYRLMFKDGYQLTMTVNGDDDPKFTTQQLLTDAGVALTPWAWSSQVGEDGEEFLHFSYYNQRTGADSKYVYEQDKGWGFSGTAMSYHFEINWFFGDSPSSFFGVKKARLYGKTQGKASLKIQSTGALSQLQSRYNSADELLDLPYTQEYYSNTMTERSSKPANLSNRGLSIQLKVSNRQASVAEPSHICQVLVLATTPGGAFDV